MKGSEGAERNWIGTSRTSSDVDKSLRRIPSALFMVSDEDMEMIAWFIAQIENEMHEMLARMGQDDPYRHQEVVVSPPAPYMTHITSAATLKCQFCGSTVPEAHYEAHLETHSGPDIPDMC